MDECKPLPSGHSCKCIDGFQIAADGKSCGLTAEARQARRGGGGVGVGRGAHSSTIHGNVTTFCGIRRVVLATKWLRLSRKVDECKPLGMGTILGITLLALTSVAGRCSLTP